MNIVYMSLLLVAFVSLVFTVTYNQGRWLIITILSLMIVAVIDVASDKRESEEKNEVLIGKCFQLFNERTGAVLISASQHVYHLRDIDGYEYRVNPIQATLAPKALCERSNDQRIDRR